MVFFLVPASIFIRHFATVAFPIVRSFVQLGIRSDGFLQFFHGHVFVYQFYHDTHYYCTKFFGSFFILQVLHTVAIQRHVKHA